MMLDRRFFPFLICVKILKVHKIVLYIIIIISFYHLVQGCYVNFLYTQFSFTLFFASFHVFTHSLIVFSIGPFQVSAALLRCLLAWTLTSHISFVGLMLSTLIKCPYHGNCRSSTLLDKTDVKLLLSVVVSDFHLAPSSQPNSFIQLFFVKFLLACYL